MAGQVFYVLVTAADILMTCLGPVVLTGLRVLSI